MADFRLRSWQKLSIGRVVLSVSLEPRADERSSDHFRSLSEWTERLVRSTNEVRLPATWGVNDPVHAAATSLVIPSGTAAGVEHEIAILGDASWVGIEAGRPRFAQELMRRATQARAKGIAATTFMHRNTEPGEHLDLLVKQGFTAVCPVQPAEKSGGSVPGPRSLHYGVWEMPLTERLPLGSGWFVRRKLFRQIERSADEGAQLHLHVDLPAVAKEGKAGQHSMLRLVEHLAELRDRGLLKVETVSQAAARLSDVPASVPQRSILRLAA